MIKSDLKVANRSGNQAKQRRAKGAQDRCAETKHAWYRNDVLTSAVSNGVCRKCGYRDTSNDVVIQPST